jgi:transcription-repair coupling factor (superfamily II helicase)
MVKRLILAAKLRYHAAYALFERIIMQRRAVTIILPKGEKEEYYKFKFVELMRYILHEHKETIKFDQKNETMKLIIKNNFETPERLLEFLIDFSVQVKNVFSAEGTVESKV